MANRASQNVFRISQTLYFCMVTALLLASLFPESRTWGINVWGFFPAWVTFALFLVGITAGIVLMRLRMNTVSAPTETGQRYWLVASVTTAVMAGLFILVRARVHFHGDGYQLLASLSEGRIPSKAWDRGTIFVITSLQGLFDPVVSSSALAAYQFYSIGSGILFTIIVFWSASRLFAHMIDRLIFALGILTAGYMVLFFGYVENYALFGLMVVSATLIGMLAVQGRIARGWIILPVVVALPLHIFSVSLIPAAIFVVVYDTRVINRMVRLPARTLWLLVGAGLLAAVGVYAYLHSHWLFFRFSVLPVWPDQFTVDNYWLFSMSHLLDILNLVLLLVPGLPLLIALMVALPRKSMRTDSVIVFLLLLSVTSLGLVFLIDPKLGMARDWDLFAFSGIPLAAMLFYVAAAYREKLPQATPIAFMAVVLSILVTGPRVAAQVDAEVGLERFRYYLALDHGRGRNARRTLFDYLVSAGREDEAIAERDRLEEEFPERSLNEASMQAFEKGRVQESIARATQAIRLNPVFPDPYFNLGYIYGQLGKTDSAIVLLEIANALNPYNGDILNTLGAAYLRKGKVEQAEKHLLAATKRDSTLYAPFVSLANLYVGQRRFDEAEDMIRKMIKHPDTPAGAFELVARNLRRQGLDNEAQKVYRVAISRGLDTTGTSPDNGPATQ